MPDAYIIFLELVAVGPRGGEVAGDAFDGLGHVAQLFHPVGLQRLDLRKTAHRRVDLRTFAGDELEVDAHRGKRQ
jgi:hypothetical protein